MKIKIIIACVLAMALAAVTSAAENTAKIKVLLITGGHPFEKEQFFKVFEENPDITFTAAEHAKTSATALDRDDLLTYDTIVLYDMPMNITAAQKANFLALFDKGIGLLVLHHALLDYPQWPDFERIIGGRYPVNDSKAGYKHGEQVPIVIVAKNHPITAGMEDFTILDEIYWGFRVGPDSTPLITTTHPKSGKPLGWYRTEKKSRVVYLQLGHDHTAYENPNYRKLVARSIKWVAEPMMTGK